MKDYEFNTHTIEWVQRTDKRTLHKGVRYCESGRFFRLRNWLFRKLSKQWSQGTFELKQVNYSDDNLIRLVVAAANSQSCRLHHIDYFIMSPETAFHAEAALAPHRFTIDVTIPDGFLTGCFPKIYGIRVVILSTYAHDDILIVLKERYR